MNPIRELVKEIKLADANIPKEPRKFIGESLSEENTVFVKIINVWLILSAKNNLNERV